MEKFEIAIEFGCGATTYLIESKSSAKAIIEAIKKYEKDKPKYMPGREIKSVYIRTNKV